MKEIDVATTTDTKGGRGVGLACAVLVVLYCCIASRFISAPSIKQLLIPQSSSRPQLSSAHQLPIQPAHNPSSHFSPSTSQSLSRCSSSTNPQYPSPSTNVPLRSPFTNRHPPCSIPGMRSFRFANALTTSRALFTSLSSALPCARMKSFWGFLPAGRMRVSGS